MTCEFCLFCMCGCQPAGGRSTCATPCAAVGGVLALIGTSFRLQSDSQLSCQVSRYRRVLPGSPNQQPLTCSNNGNNKLSKQLGKTAVQVGESEKCALTRGQAGGWGSEKIRWKQRKSRKWSPQSESEKKQLLTYSKARTSHNLRSFPSPKLGAI